MTPFLMLALRMEMEHLDTSGPSFGASATLRGGVGWVSKPVPRHWRLHDATSHVEHCIMALTSQPFLATSRDALD